MFTMLYRLFKSLDKLLTNVTGKTLGDFSDSANISNCATEAVQTLVADGIISGSNGKLSLSVISTRAQMAQVIYNLFN